VLRRHVLSPLYGRNAVPRLQILTILKIYPVNGSRHGALAGRNGSFTGRLIRCRRLLVPIWTVLCQLIMGR
jgi:hypothetical protein